MPNSNTSPATDPATLVFNINPGQWQVIDEGYDFFGGQQRFYRIDRNDFSAQTPATFKHEMSSPPFFLDGGRAANTNHDYRWVPGWNKILIYNRTNRRMTVSLWK